MLLFIQFSHINIFCTSMNMIFFFTFWGRCLYRDKELRTYVTGVPSALFYKHVLDTVLPFPSLVLQFLKIIPSSIIFLFAFTRFWLLLMSLMPSYLYLSLCLIITLPFQFLLQASFFILPLLSCRAMQLSWCTRRWLISATWLWPRPWRWGLVETPMGLLGQARLSRSKP